MPPCSSDSSQDSSSCERGASSANSRASSPANSAEGNARPASFRDEPVAGIATAATPSSPASAAHQESKRRRPHDDDVGDQSPGSPDAAGQSRYRTHRTKPMPMLALGEQENIADGGRHRRRRHRGSLDQKPPRREPPARSMSQSPQTGRGAFMTQTMERLQQTGDMKRKKITMSDL